MAERIRFEYHRPGKAVHEFEQWLVLDRPDVKVLFLEEYTGAALETGGDVMQETGAPMIWYVFPEKWHDIARFHRVDGTHTGWYTNLIKPFEFGAAAWRATDLFLDLWQPLGGAPRWLDEDELEAAVRAGTIDAMTRKRIENERTVIELQLQGGAWPPPVAHDVDLGQVRMLMEATG